MTKAKAIWKTFLIGTPIAAWIGSLVFTGIWDHGRWYGVSVLAPVALVVVGFIGYGIVAGTREYLAWFRALPNRRQYQLSQARASIQEHRREITKLDTQIAALRGLNQESSPGDPISGQLAKATQ